jgi:ABC-2 type transport system permease protein
VLPPSAPLTMPVRMSLGAAARWEIGLSVLLCLASIVGLVRAAARLYDGAVPRTGGRVKIREAWSATR